MPDCWNHPHTYVPSFMDKNSNCWNGKYSFFAWLFWRVFEYIFPTTATERKMQKNGKYMYIKQQHNNQSICIDFLPLALESFVFLWNKQYGRNRILYVYVKLHLPGPLAPCHATTNSGEITLPFYRARSAHHPVGRNFKMFLFSWKKPAKTCSWTFLM